MKTTYLVLIILVFFTLGCENYLEVTPENAVTYRQFFENEAEIELFMHGIRDDWMKNEAGFHIKKNQRSMVMDAADSYIWEGHFLRSGYYTTDFIDWSWSSIYGNIVSCYELLQHMPNAEMPAERNNFYQGMCHFYIAFNYYNLAKYYGDAAIIKEAGADGKVAKSSYAEVLEFAKENAAIAINRLNEYGKAIDLNGQTILDRDIPTKDAARTLYAEICAWKGSIDKENNSLQEAVDTLSVVINSGTYTLAANPEAVVTSTLVGADPASIYEILMIADELRISTGYYTGFYSISWPVNSLLDMGDIKNATVRISNATVRSMYKDGDLRRDAYFYDFENMDTVDVAITGGFAYPYKFRKVRLPIESWETNIRLIDQHAVVYRLANLILLRAECNAKLGNTADAITDMNTIRSRAQAPLYDASELNDSTDIHYLVFKEREKEFIGEPQRHADIIRNGYWRTELKEDFQTLTDKDVKDGALYYPIIGLDFRENPLMTQNKFWLKFK